MSLQDNVLVLLIVSVAPELTVMDAASGSISSVTFWPDIILTCLVASGTLAHPHVPATLQFPLATFELQPFGANLAHHVPHLDVLPPTVGAALGFAYS